MMQGNEQLEPFLKGVWSRTWQLFQAQALTFILASLLVLVLMVVSIGILTGPLLVGYIELVRKAGRNEPIAVGDVFKGFDFFASSFFASILVGLMVVVGCMLLFLPGLAAALFTLFALHAIAFENRGAIDAIGRSMRLVRDNFVNVLILFILVMIAQSIGGSVLLGTLITFPLSLIVFTVAYERLLVPPGVITTTGEAIPV
jgi:hypothetical protein